MVRKVVYRLSELKAKKERIDQRKYTYPDIIAATGMTDYAIRGLMQGRKKVLDLDEIAILCDFFNCQPGDLYAFVDQHEISEDEEESEDVPDGVFA